MSRVPGCLLTSVTVDFVPFPLLGPDVARCPSDKPFHVEFGGRRWWYVAEAVRLADDAPAADGAATRRPTTGDRVVLTADYASHGDAADGEIPAALALSQLHRSTGSSSPGIFHPLCALLTLSVALQARCTLVTWVSFRRTTTQVREGHLHVLPSVSRMLHAPGGCL